MARTSPLMRSGTPAIALSVGRLTIRRSRAALRKRVRHRWWTVALHAPSGLCLRPAEPADAGAWQRLVDAAGARPDQVGMAASPLGGAAHSRTRWIERCLDLRADARRGHAYVYLVERGGELLGEALGLVDDGTSTVQLLVWLRPDASTPDEVAAVVDLLGRHVLAGPYGPRRARCSVPDDNAALLAKLSELQYTVEGTLGDPPHGNRAALVTAGAGKPDGTGPSAASDRGEGR